MAGRNIKDYIGLSRNINTNQRFTEISKKGKSIGFFHKFRGLLDESIFAWISHDYTVHAPHEYKVNTSKGSIYDIPVNPLKIAIAADWASDTVQSEKIADLIRDKNADYTIHLGDTYYSGTDQETTSNFKSEGNDRWPIGKLGSFALLGNHEMYSGGFSYFDNLLPNILKQDNPFFCLRNDYWCILGLDTGYQSIIGKPQNTELNFQDELFNWLRDVVQIKDEKRGVIVLTHHQFISAFKQEKEFHNPAKQLKELLPEGKEIIWIWGHEHRFSMYSKNPPKPDNEFITSYGRCIGNGGMPCEIRDIDQSSTSKNSLVLWDSRIADSFFSILHPPKVYITNNGYAMIEIDRQNLKITYYASYTSDINADPTESPIITESWISNNITGEITCIGIEDLTILDEKSELSYYSETPDPERAGNNKIIAKSN